MSSLKNGVATLLVMATGLILGCSDSGGTDIAGISGTGSQVGSVNGFGSVIVNGVRYDSTGAAIFIDGQAANEGDLAVGMVVLVQGDIDGEFDGTAERIDFDRTLCGTIESIDSDNGNFVAVGIQVNTDQSTVFTTGSFNTLAVGNVVRVSGYHAPNGIIAAGFVDVSACATAPLVDVEGFVENLDAPGRRFNIGGLNVEYSRAVMNEENGLLSDGALVEVRGRRSGAGADLVANQITVLSGIVGAPSSDGNLEGIVNNFVSKSDFRIGLQAVDISDATEKDLAFEEPANGVRVHVQGSVDENNVLVAHRYYVIPDNVYRIATTIDYKSANFNQFGLFNEPHWFLPITAFEDNSSLNKQNYGPSDLVAGDYVVITGYRGTANGPPGNITAARIERINNPSSAEVRGPTDSSDIGSETIVIGGITILTDCGNTTTCLDSTGAVVSATAFYAELTVGEVLQAVGNEVSQQLQATTIQHD